MKSINKLRTKNAFFFTVFCSALIFMASCSKDNNDVRPSDKGQLQITGVTGEGIDAVDVSNLPVGVLFNHSEGADTIDHYVLFRFSDASVVPIADSASGNWDIGFYGKNIMTATDIILNNSVHGAGVAEGQIVDQPFDQLMEAPADGYSVDSAVTSTVNVGPHPIKVNPTNVFTLAPYYTGQPDHLILPKTDITYVIHTNDDKYVKLTITNTYKGAPKTDDLDFKTSEFGYFTFKYVINQDGDRSFSEE